MILLQKQLSKIGAVNFKTAKNLKINTIYKRRYKAFIFTNSLQPGVAFQGVYKSKSELEWVNVLVSSRSNSKKLNLLSINQCEYINPFPTNVPLLYPLKVSVNFQFSDDFRGYGSGTLVENGLIWL